METNLMNFQIPNYLNYMLIPICAALIALFVIRRTGAKKGEIIYKIAQLISLAFAILCIDAIVSVYEFQNRLVLLLFTYGIGVAIVAKIVVYVVRIIQKNEIEIKKYGEKMEEQISRGKSIAETLTRSAEVMSTNSEEILNSSEAIATSQQQISKGASNQVTAINETQQKFSLLTSGIKEINEKIKQISEISEMIIGIANQTNMLALNAAIEAARAGESGRGFNVVAEQVRKLSEQSKSAVAETEKKLKDIIFVTNMQESHTFEVLKQIDNIAAIAEEISSSTEEAAASAEEQAATMEQTTTTSVELLKIAESLKSELFR